VSQYKFRVGSHLPSVNNDPDFLGMNIQFFQRYGKGHKYPTSRYTHDRVIDQVNGPMIGIAEQTAPYAKRSLIHEETLCAWLRSGKYDLYEPAFETTVEGETALQGYIDGRIARPAPYDAQQLLFYWRNCYAYNFQGLPHDECIRKWWVFEDRADEDVCSSFGGLCHVVLMKAEGQDLAGVFGGYNPSYWTPSDIGNEPTLKRVIFSK
jgi:hypothetical protein